MADRTFINSGIMEGTYAGTPFEDSRSSIVEVTLAEVPFEKSADQEIWFSGPLTLTFTVDNSEGAGSLDAIVISDLLDNTKFRYIANSLTAQLATTTDPVVVTPLVLDTDYTIVYTANTTDDPTKDLLEISFLPAPGAAASIPVGSKVTISFRGEKVPA